jgi:hypothetical protein
MFRNGSYRKWLGAFNFMGKPLKGKQMSWQVIQVLSTGHAQQSSKDWWGPYQDCVFRVFSQPETRYSKYVADHVQWYVLSPEDSELVNRWEAKKKGVDAPPRSALKGERYISIHPNLRKARLIPVECCRHFRHETTGGTLPGGL